MRSEIRTGVPGLDVSLDEPKWIRWKAVSFRLSRERSEYNIPTSNELGARTCSLALAELAK